MKLGEMTDADKAVDPHFGSKLIDIKILIRINPEIQTRISDHFQLHCLSEWYCCICTERSRLRLFTAVSA